MIKEIHDWVEANILRLPNDKWPLALVVVCGCTLALAVLIKAYPIALALENVILRCLAKRATREQLR